MNPGAIASGSQRAVPGEASINLRSQRSYDGAGRRSRRRCRSVDYDWAGPDKGMVAVRPAGGSNVDDFIRLVLRTSSNQVGNDYTADCDCAVLTVNADLLNELARLLRHTRQLGQEEDTLYEVSFWTLWGPDYYGWDLLGTCEEAGLEVEAIERAGAWPSPAWFDLQRFAPQRVECSQLIIRLEPGGKAELQWSAIPKHTDTTMTTTPISLDQLTGAFVARGTNQIAAAAGYHPES